MFRLASRQLARPLLMPTVPRPLTRSLITRATLLRPLLRSSAPLRLGLRFQSSSTDTKPDLKLSPKDSKASGMKDILRLFSLAKPEWKSIVLALVCIVFSSGVSMLIPAVIGKLLDTTGDEIYGMKLSTFYTALAGIFIVGAVANTGRVVILKVVGEKLVARLRTRTLKASLQQDGAFLDTNRVGDLISRLSSDASIVSKSVTQNISDGTRAVISGVVGATMMSFISLKLTGVMLLLAPPLGVMAMVYGKRIRNLSRQLQASVGDLTKVAEEQLSATKTIQAYGGERREIRRYADEVKNVFKIGYKEAVTSGAFFGVTGFFGNVGLLALLLTGTSMIRSGAMTVGDLSSFMMYAVYTGSSLFGLSNFYSELMKGAGAAARVFELNDRKPLIHPTIGKDPVSLAGKPIIFENVHFAYPTRPDTKIFSGLNLQVNPGEHVCIVGPSGGGKSTITSLLLRYYDPASGSIRIGDDEISSFNLRKYRRLLGVVQQEPLLFSGTIRGNLTYALPPHSQEEIDQALRDSNSTKFLQQFPDGCETVVGPRGAQLSGGQKQRIALARSAFLAKPSVLILDEATSALDALSEEVVARSLEKRCQDGLITISIAHRVSTIKQSTRVIVLNKQGFVQETGSFEELKANRDSALNVLLSKDMAEEPHSAVDNEADFIEIEQDQQKQLEQREKDDLQLKM